MKVEKVKPVKLDHAYRRGYPLETLNGWMEKLLIKFRPTMWKTPLQEIAQIMSASSKLTHKLLLDKAFYWQKFHSPLLA